jgi:hypothetical protein
MIYRNYGKTGKEVSLLGFGGSRFNTDKNDFEKNIELVLKAVQFGVNYFDTAPNYANSTSQKIIGEALSQTKVKTYISSKTSSKEDRTASDVLRRIDISLKELKRDKIDFFTLWSILDIDHFKTAAKPNGCLDGIIEAKRQGLIDHVCISVHCNDEEIIEILDCYNFDGITLGLNMLNYQYRTKGLERAGELGLGVAIMNPLAGGLIPRNHKLFGFDNSENAVDKAIKFVISHEQVSTCLIGVNSERDLVEAEKYISKGDFLNSEKLVQNYNQFTYTHKWEGICTSCGYCSDCPKKIKLPKLMSVYNEYILSGKDIGFYRFKLSEMFGFHSQQIFDCIGCGKCESKCTQHLPIIDRIKEINEFANEQIIYWDRIVNKVMPETKFQAFGIYGANLDAERLLMAMKRLGWNLDSLKIYLFDSDPRKQGQLFYGNYTIYTPEDVLKYNVKHIVVTAPKYYTEIKSHLLTFVDNDTTIISI